MPDGMHRGGSVEPGVPWFLDDFTVLSPDSVRGKRPATEAPDPLAPGPLAPGDGGILPQDLVDPDDAFEVTAPEIDPLPGIVTIAPSQSAAEVDAPPSPDIALAGNGEAAAGDPAPDPGVAAVADMVDLADLEMPSPVFSDEAASLEPAGSDGEAPATAGGFDADPASQDQGDEAGDDLDGDEAGDDLDGDEAGDDLDGDEAGDGLDDGAGDGLDDDAGDDTVPAGQTDDSPGLSAAGTDSLVDSGEITFEGIEVVEW